MTAEPLPLDFRAYDPQDMLALLESEAAFEQRFGVPPAKGLRGFFASDDVPPAFLDMLRSAEGPNPWRFGFAVIEPRRQVVIGNAGFKGEPDEAGVVEIAYGIVPSFEGRGYATESAAHLIRFASADSRVKCLRAHTLPERNASARVLSKNGFAQVGVVEDPEDGTVWRWERLPE
jgi:RimJ/RimL family protein N-acetyltransferase